MQKEVFGKLMSVAAAGLIAGTTLVARSENSLASQTSSSETPSPSPTPALNFEVPKPVQRSQHMNPLSPVFTPGTVAHPPAWTGEATVSFYCLTTPTRIGSSPREGTIATDPADIPLGSQVRIEELGEFMAEDTGALVKGTHIDVWKASCKEAKRLGIMLKRFKVIRWGW